MLFGAGQHGLKAQAEASRPFFLSLIYRRIYLKRFVYQHD